MGGRAIRERSGGVAAERANEGGGVRVRGDGRATRRCSTRCCEPESPVGFAFFDRGLRFALDKEALAGINGLAVAAHRRWTVGAVVPAMAASQEPLICGVLETGEPVVGREVNGETPRVPGQRRHWLVSYYPVEGKRGERVGVGAVVAGITKQVDLDRLHRDFLAMETHDLRGPSPQCRATRSYCGAGVTGLHDRGDSVSGRLPAAAARRPHGRRPTGGSGPSLRPSRVDPVG